MNDQSALESERESVSDLGQQMLEQGLTKGTGGNVSERGDDARIAISPSRVPYEDITPDSVSVITLDGDQVFGDLPPSSEAPMHRIIYRNRDDVGGVVHTHSPYASTFAALGKPIPASHYLLAYAGKEVPVAGYEEPGTEALGRLAIDALGQDYQACLLQHHGVIALGADADQALETALMVEFCARVHYQASNIGEPIVLSDDDLDNLITNFEEYRQLG